MWDAQYCAMLSGKCITLNGYIRGKEMLRTNDVSFTFKTLEKSRANPKLVEGKTQ